MTKKPETRLKEKVKRELALLPNLWIEKIQQRCIRGTPDFLGVIQGRGLALELKSETGKLEPLQQRKLQLFRQAGGIAHVVDPDNFEEVLEELCVIVGLKNRG